MHAPRLIIGKKYKNNLNIYEVLSFDQPSMMYVYRQHDGRICTINHDKTNNWTLVEATPLEFPVSKVIINKIGGQVEPILSEAQLKKLKCITRGNSSHVMADYRIKDGRIMVLVKPEE